MGPRSSCGTAFARLATLAVEAFASGAREHRGEPGYSVGVRRFLATLILVSAFASSAEAQLIRRVRPHIL